VPWITRLSSFSLGALLALSALGVHELRYRMGFGEAAAQMLSAHGHGYLMAVGPLVGVWAALVLGCGVKRWASGRSAPADARWRLAVLWPALSFALAAIFSVQELIEGAVSSGHPSGVAAVVAGGGWIAFVVAIAIGLALALVLRFGQHLAVERLRAARPSHPSGTARLVWCGPSGPAIAALRSPASARGPPLPA